MNSNLVHPLITKFAKNCSKCHYTLSSVTAKHHVDPHTKEKITTNKVVFTHGDKDLPFLVHSFVRKEMSPMSPLSKDYYGSPHRQVTLRINKLPHGHELHFHSIEITK
jgi:hypothetical protein